MAEKGSAKAKSSAPARAKTPASKSTSNSTKSAAKATAKAKVARTKAAAKSVAAKPGGSGARAKTTAQRRSPKAAARIANLLRREIVTGALQPGDMLLPERVLQEKFDVSRPTLREAMRLLESESLIRISRGQHGGAHVQKLDTSVTARQVGMYLQMEGTTLADVLQARAFLEPPAAGLIARNRSLAVIEKLR